MTLPRKALIGPFAYRISDKPADWARYAPEQADKHWGLTLHDPAVILLRHDMNPTMTRAILLHELLHAVTVCGAALCSTSKRTDEEWTTLAAPGLLDAVTRSPGLAAYLFGGGA